MASIQVGSGRRGRRPVDADVALIPFIDLLLCCVMFLLVTAVWNQLESIRANQATPGAEEAAPPPSAPELVLRIAEQGYVLGSDVGDRIDIPRSGGSWDAQALREHLEARRRMDSADTRLVVAPDDGIRYETVVGAMDTVTGAGYAEVSLTPAAGM